jgi:glucose/arabinose dehydrogenase
MTSRAGKVLAAVLLATIVAGTSALGAGSGGPTTRKGAPAQLVAGRVATPTSFAFGAGQVFFSDGTPPEAAPVGGVYWIHRGKAVKLLGSPPFAFGVAWHKGTLYISAANRILAWSGWTGTIFSHQRTIYRQSSIHFTGFNGLAFGANGRLYVGVGVGGHNDHGPATGPFQYDVISMSAKGTHVKVVARGMRQPWQLAFPKGSSSPYVSDLGQDSGAKNPPDFVLRVRKGQNYGFPKCNRTKASACKGDARPLQFFPSHTDPMGLGIVGNRLFISEFGAATPARVVSIPLRGGRPRVELGGFPKGRNIVALGAHKGWVYVAEVAASARKLGAIYRFKP